MEAKTPARRPIAEPTDRFLRLLVVLLVVFLFSGLEESTLTRFTLGVLNVLAVFVLFRTTGIPTWVPKRLAMVAIGVLIGVVVVLSPWSGHAARAITGFCGALVILFMLMCVLWRVFEKRDMKIQTIAGAVCAYLLFGLFFTSVYAACNALDPGKFFTEPVTYPDFGYFSFTTLLTVGYGDITVLNNFGRRLAMLEALTGQVFLATAVAQLISSIRSSPPPGPETDAG